MTIVGKINISNKPAVRKVKDYFLHTKTGKMNVQDFKISNCEIPKEALEFSYLKIGKKSDNLFSKEIIAFFDTTGKLIQQVFKTNGEEFAKRDYSYLKNHTRVVDIYEAGEKIASELQKINISKNNAKQLLTKRINYLQDKNKNPIQEIIFTHFPQIGKQKIEPKLVASAKVIERNGQKVLTDFQKSGFSSTFNISKNDKYLLFRFLGLNTEEGLIELTKRLLKEKQIFKLNLKIKVSPTLLDENLEGGFSVRNRGINYSSSIMKKLPLRAVNTIAHEVEHAYQYSQIGRLGKGKSAYETDALNLLGDLKFKDMIEAIKYADAIYEYPRYVPGEDLSKNEKYLSNYLEVKAREAGRIAEEKYMHSNMQNYLFFDLAYNS